MDIERVRVQGSSQGAVRRFAPEEAQLALQEIAATLQVLSAGRVFSAPKARGQASRFVSPGERRA